LVDEQLAACVNILSGVRSVYVWEDELCEEKEDTLMIKTTDERYEEMKGWLRDAHSYDVPEIVAIESTDVLDDYLDWARRQTGGEA
jgi:periplasmic divalent cation tolerance protein